MRETHAEPLALGAAPVGPGHVGCSPGLIDEYEPFRIQIGLAIEPGLAKVFYICPVLLYRVASLFLRVWL